MQIRARRAVLWLMTALADTTLYKNDFTLGADVGFAAGVSGYWSSGSTSTTPSGRHGRFRGEFSDQTVSLSLTDLPPHREVTVSLSLYVLKSWDGSQLIDPFGGARVGPDVWGLHVSGGPTLLSTTFSNIARFTGNGYPGLTYPQAYPGSFPGADFPPGTGSEAIHTLGYQFVGVPMDAVYRLNFTFRHTGSTLTGDSFAGGTAQLRRPVSRIHRAARRRGSAHPEWRPAVAR